MKLITDREKELVVELYAKGMALRKIAAYASLSQTTVLKIVREAGAELRGTKAQYREEEQARVRKLYAEGKSIKDIMRLTGIRSEQTIYRFVQAARRKRKNTM